jgi:plastocyanin
MRFSKVAVIAGAFALVGCGGGDSTPEATQTPATPPAAAPTATGAPITGKTEVVQMIQNADATQFMFSPATLTIKAGDGIRFDSVSGAPHNVGFDMATVPDAAKAVLVANMPNQELGELQSKMMNNGESLTISFANVPPGTYKINCTPHLAMGMVMTVTVQ